MKYKLFLVEDEIGIRDNMKNSINWDETDFIYCGDAGDGELALPLILQQQPDVLITDIKMPFMDGLTLSKAVKNCMPYIKIILISGYEDFEYARRAISIGVTDYLLKPITPNKLLEVLAKVAQEIHFVRGTNQYISALRSQLDSTRPILINKFLFDLISGEKDLPSIYEEAEKLYINIVSSYYCIAIYYCDSEQIAIDKMKKTVSSFGCYLFQKSLNEYCLLLQGDTEDKIMTITNRLCEDLKVFQNDNHNYCFGVGMPVTRITEISQSYKQACYCISMKDSIRLQGVIIYYNEIQHHKSEKVLRNVLSAANKQVLFSFLKSGLSSEVKVFLEDFYMKLELDKISEQQEVYLWISIYEIIKEFLTSIDCDSVTIEAVVPNITKKYNREGNFKNLQELLLDSLRLRDNKQNNKFKNIIIKTKNYIEENYNKTELLYDAAKTAYISAGYLNNIFKKELGFTVPEYISAIRIKKAKKYLRTTNLQISEIAEKTGYQDPNYFSTVFKKQTGMTPNEYRKK